MARRSAEPAFIEALARGLDVIKAFDPGRPSMTLAELTERTGLARPTAHRILLTLVELGYVRSSENRFSLTPKILELSLAFVQSTGLWEVARPHMEDLVSHTNEPSSIVQLDGSDIVYVARVAVPKTVGLSVHIGTRFPAMQTSLGQVILAEMEVAELEDALAQPSRSGVVPHWNPSAAERAAVLTKVREQGYALTDGQLAPGVRSIAVPIHGPEQKAVAALNVNTSAVDKSLDLLLEDYLPVLRRTAQRIAEDWALMGTLPLTVAGE